MKTSRYIIIVFVSILAAALIYNIAKNPVPSFSAPDEEPQLHQDSVYSYYQSYKSLFQKAVNGNETEGESREGREAATWLRSRFFDFRLPYYTQRKYSEPVHPELKPVENVYAVSKGSVYPNEFILVVCSYANPVINHSGETASVNSGGVAINTELASIFAKEEHNYSIIFLFAESVNGKKFAGIKSFLSDFEGTEKIKAVLVLDEPAKGKTGYLDLYPAGINNGYSPLWLRETAATAAEQFLQVKSYNLLEEWAVRTFNITGSAAGFFLKDDIPAISLRLLGTGTKAELWSGSMLSDNSSYSKDIENGAKSVLLSTGQKNDTGKAEAFSSDSVINQQKNLIYLENYGKALEQTIRLIDKKPEYPEEPHFYLKAGNSYLTKSSIGIIQVFFLLPLSFTLFYHYRNRRRMSGFSAMLRREALRWLKVFIAGTAAYLLLRALPNLGMARHYEEFIVTGFDFSASGISLLTLIIVFAAFPFAVFFAANHSLRRHNIPVSWDWEGARLFVLMGIAFIYILSIISGTALWTSSFMLPALYIFPLIKEGRERWNRYRNLILILPTLLFYFIFISVFAGVIGVSSTAGYLVTAALYGLICPLKIIYLIGAIAIYALAVNVAWQSSPPETITEAGLNR